MAYQSWQQLMADGSKTHNNGDYEGAQRLFSTAAELSLLIIDRLDEHDTMRMYLVANHNLSASFNACAKVLQAETALFEMHNTVAGICQSSCYSRDIRLNALAVLDDSLFSLLSHLGTQGKQDEVHRVLLETESIAEAAAKQLFH